MTIGYFNPSGRAQPGMAQAVRTGPFVHVSGQVALDADGEVVGEYDAAAQARQCFANLALALDAAGAGLTDVIKLTCYLTDKTAYPDYAAVKGELFGDRPPASTAVIVDELLIPGLVLEIDAIAWREQP